MALPVGWARLRGTGGRVVRDMFYFLNRRQDSFRLSEKKISRARGMQVAQSIRFFLLAYHKFTILVIFSSRFCSSKLEINYKVGFYASSRIDAFYP